MNEIEKDIMKGLVAILNEASDAYYNTGNPIMTDAQFDMRLSDLRQLEEETGFIFSNSPTRNVGAKVLTELNEITHNHPMLSLDKIHSVEELIKFANNKELVASIKLNGLTVSIKYENGILATAETRGDGYVGSDITEHIKHFLNVPLKINKEGTYIVDGEAIIEDEDFLEINKDSEFKNSRNLAAGTLSVLDTSLVANRKLKFYVWDVIEGGSNSLIDNLTDAKELGFDVVPKWLATNFDPKNLQSNIDFVFDFAKEEGLPCDGVVFKFNDIEYGKSLGATGHHFKNGVAYKREDDVYKTELIDIDWTLGKTGQITPTAVFKSVEIDGTSVERASLSNLSIMEETLGTPFKGEEIFVSKRNMIIPKVERALKLLFPPEKNIIDIPSTCPICGGKTEIKQDNNSKVLVCKNDNCKGKLLGKLTHFVSKNAMNIDGMSESTLEKFIELGYVNSFADIYELKSRFYDELIKLDGFGKKSVDKLMYAVEKSKTTTLDRFIYSLSIPLIGKSASKTIAKCFDYDFKNFYFSCCTDFDFRVLDDFGDSMNESIEKYFNENADMVNELSCYMNFKKQDISNNFNNLSGKVFVITGSLEHFSNRDEAKEKIEAAGGKVSGSVSVKTSYLVNNDIHSTSGKNKKAIELGVKIISEDELIDMLK